MKNWILALGVAAAMWFATVAGAQQAVHVTHEYEDWTLSPIVLNGEVTGFLCYIDPAAVIGNNIPLIWYKKNGDGTWDTYGWSDYDLGSAVMYLRTSYDDLTLLQADSFLNAEQGPSSSPTPPKEIIDGLYFDDPAHQMIQGVTPTTAEQVIQLLVDIGWEAAPKLSVMMIREEDILCDPGQVSLKEVELLLRELTFKTEIALFGSPQNPIDCIPVGCTGCVKHINSPVPRNNGSWIYKGSGLAGGRKMCYYDYPATEMWWETGISKWCFECDDNGIRNAVFRSTVIVGENEACHPPAWEP